MLKTYYFETCSSCSEGGCWFLFLGNGPTQQVQQKARTKTKAEPPASGGKSANTKRQEALRSSRGAKDEKPASGGRPRCEEKPNIDKKGAKDEKPASGGRPPPATGGGASRSHTQKGETRPLWSKRSPQPASSSNAGTHAMSSVKGRDKPAIGGQKRSRAASKSPQRNVLARRGVLRRIGSRSPSPATRGETRETKSDSESGSGSRSPATGGGRNKVALLRPGPSAEMRRRLGNWVHDWPQYRSEEILRSPKGLANAAYRNIGKQTCMLDGSSRFRKLFQVMPRGERPATGGREDLHTIKCLLNLHRGELREWFGMWEVQKGPMPTQHMALGMWQAQFFPPHADEVAAGALSIVLHHRGKTSHCVRVATVFGLADLFCDLGQEYTAAELYDLYLDLRIFANVRSNTRPRSREGLGSWPASGGWLCP